MQTLFRTLALLLSAPAWAVDTRALLDRVRQAATPAAAEQILLAALPETEAAGDPAALAEVRYALGRQRQRMNDLPAAIAWFEKALVLRRAGADRFALGLVLHNLGVAEWGLAVNDAARAHLEEALALRAALADAPGVAYTRLALANVHWAWGDLPEALRAYQSVAADWRALGNANGEAHALNNSGLVLAALGDPRAAAAAHRQALPLFAQTKDPLMVAYTRSNLGLALAALGQTAAATAEYRAALTALEEKKDARGLAYVRQNLADVLLDAGQTAEARRLYEESLAGKRSIGDRYGEAYAQARLAQLHLRAGHPAEAGAAAREAIALHRAGGDRAGLGAALTTLARAEWAAGREEESLATIAEARAQVEDLRGRVVSPDLRASYFATQRSVYDFEISRRLARREPALALALSERARARLLLDELGETPAPAGARERQLRRELAAQEQRLQRGDAGARERISPLIRDWRTARAALQKEVAAEPLDAPPLIARLAAPNLTLIEFWLGEDEGAAFTITPAGVRATPIPGRRRLTAEIDAFLAALTARNRFPAGETREARAARLARADAEWRTRQAVLARLLPPARGRLVIAPEGPLARLPWALFYGGETVVTPSLSVVAARRGQPAPAGPARLTIVAAPAFADPQLPPLPFASREAAAIARLDPGATLLAGAGATKAALDRLWAPTRRLHLATHALLDEQDPALSGIALADGTLRLYELYGRSLAADLVVLSACRSADGAEIRGEGVMGLARGFLHAGARRVVATLWSVDDQASARFMEHFYGALLTRKLRPAAALAAARRALEAEPRWAHPVYWAAFTLQGDWE